MGSLNWEDGSPSMGSVMGSLLGGLKAAPGKALDDMAKADAIAWNRRTKLANAAASEAAESAIAPASVPPRAYTAADIATPAILDAPLNALKPPSSALETLTPGSNQIIDPVALAHAKAQRNLAVKATQATLLDKPELWAPQLSLSNVASRGPGATATERAQDTFLTTGRYPNAEESKIQPAQNLTKVNADGSPTGIVVSTRNGQTTLEGDSLASQLQPGQRWVETGSAAAVPGLDENNAKQRLAIIASNIRGRDPTSEEAFAIQTLAPIAYKSSRVEEDSTERPGQKDIKYIHTEEIPPVVAEMMRRAGMLRAPGVTPEQQAAARTVTAAAAPAPGAEGPVAPVPPATAAAAVAPIVTAEEAARALNPNAARVAGEVPGDPAKIRDDVVKAKPVVQYLNSIPSYNAMVTAATQPATNETDLQIIYSLAKILDPESAVLTGELALARGSGTLYEQLRAMRNKLVEGKGLLDGEQRANLLEQARVRMSEYNTGKDGVVDYYANTVAPSQKIDPKLAIPPIPPMKEFTREQVLKAAGTETSAPATVTTGPSSTPGATIPPPRPETPAQQRARELLGR